jgi:predicted phage terminase large subunit-like protein
MSLSTVDLLKKQAEAEVARRVLAGRQMLNFTEYTFPKYIADPFHKSVAEALDDIVDGRNQRLMIFAPPQHGKSELVSIRLPCFWLGNHPELPVLLTSYGGALAFRNSRAARTVMESYEFKTIFPGIETNPRSRAVDSWKIHKHKGFVVAAGVGGPITGHGAGLGIIDDPVQSWAMAQSETFRDSVWEWYQGTFRTRIWEGGAIVLIMTRWHQDDLAGRLLKEHRDDWKVLHYPAVCDDPEADPLGRKEGDPLSPSRYSSEELIRIANDVGPTVWTAEYQGRPAPPSGIFFKIEKIGYISVAPPAPERVVRFWDLAATEAKMGRDPDYTVGALWSKDGHMYTFRDIVRGRWSPKDVESHVIRTAIEDRAEYGDKLEIWIEEEPGAAGKHLIEHYTTLLAGFNIRSERSSGSKPVRAQPLSAQMEAGHIQFVIAPWNTDAAQEFRFFPAGLKDDIVDSSSGAFNQLAGGPRWSEMEFLHLGMEPDAEEKDTRQEADEPESDRNTALAL